METQERNAIEMLALLCKNSGCVISDSGGKDSSVLKHIAIKAHEKYGVPFSIQHNHTTVDAPETVYFVRDEKRRYEAAGIEYKILYPRRTMWQLIVDHATPPTRLMRYCCADLKEYSGHGEKLVTGVRKAESKNRKDNQGAVTFPKPKKKLKQDQERRTAHRHCPRPAEERWCPVRSPKENHNEGTFAVYGKEPGG